MIFAALEQVASRDPGREAVSAAARRWTYGQLYAEAQRLASTSKYPEGSPVAVSASDVPQMISALAALDRAGTAAVLLPSHVQSAQVPFSGLNRGEVVLFTSGTSGPPKPAVHTWSSLAAAVKRRDQRCRAGGWLLAYQPQTFAGMQVVLRAILTGGTLVVPADRSPDAALRCLRQERVNTVSATPTFWRTLLCSVECDELKNCGLRQVTLGGEMADQPLLDALAELFPDARTSHVYASTEMGVCFAVHDGRAGFPAAWLEAERGPACRMRIAEDGELLVQSPRRMRRYADGSPSVGEGWFATGDLVRVDGERVLFAGRKSDTIHVGGNKVQPADVEAVIAVCDGVRQVRVYGVESSLTGQLVAAEVWPSDSADEDQLRRQILAHCRRLLPKHMAPAMIAFAARVDATGEKLSRQGVASGG